jgi:hypothetical protein
VPVDLLWPGAIVQAAHPGCFLETGGLPLLAPGAARTKIRPASTAGAVVVEASIDAT